MIEMLAATYCLGAGWWAGNYWDGRIDPTGGVETLVGDLCAAALIGATWPFFAIYFSVRK